MPELSASKIQKNPKYHQLIKERDMLAWTLTVLVLVIYFGFILLVAGLPHEAHIGHQRYSDRHAGRRRGDRGVHRVDGHLRVPRQHDLRSAH